MYLMFPTIKKVISNHNKILTTDQHDDCWSLLYLLELVIKLDIFGFFKVNYLLS